MENTIKKINNKISFFKNNKKLSLFNAAVIILIISLLAELFVFNYKAFLTSGYEEIKAENILYGSGIELTSDDSFKIVSETDKYIEIDEINNEAKNIYIDIERKTLSKASDIKTRIKLDATDKGNKLYFSLPSVTVVKGVERSKYISLKLSGETEKIRINIEEAQGAELVLNRISINKRVPFSFNLIRLIVFYMLLMLVYMLLPSTGLYKYKVKWGCYNRCLIIICLCLLNIFVFAYFVKANPMFSVRALTMANHRQYNDLAQALTEGHFYLDEEPSQEIKNMENPYDYRLRAQVMKDTGSDFRWDTAYYNGKYYVYFGIVPVLVFYLPAMLLFNISFNASVGIFITSVVLIPGVFLLMKCIIKKWFKDTPFIVYLILSFLMINCCGTILYIKRPDFYSLPIFMAITFSIWGLYFWLKSVEDENKLKGLYLFFGSVCMALVAGCRPQLLLGSFFAAPVFGEEVLKKRTLFSKQGIKKTAAFAAPYVVTAVFLMYYNYARFGSVFDFGANYNLTFNDMTIRGFRLSRIPLGIFMYIFQPVNLSAIFPFVARASITTNYMGVTISEMMFGGVLSCYAILWINGALFAARHMFVKKRLFFIALMGIIFSVVIVIADTQMAGILLRYFGDFSWFLFLSASLIILTLLQGFKSDEAKKYLLYFTAAGFILSLLFNAALLFIMSENSVYIENPELFYKVMHSVQFWL